MEAAVPHSAAPPACDLKSPKLDHRPRAVSVNGVTIPRGEIARETQMHAAPTPILAWKAAARALVIRELLRQEAARRNIAATPLDDGEGRRETADEAAMRVLIETDVRLPEADEATCQRYYGQNRAKFHSATLYAPRHILLAAAPDDRQAREATRDEAERLAAVLNEKPSLFETIAAEVSACPSGKTGGSLGQIGPGQTVPEFEKALEAMSVGDAVVLVESRYGFHLVRLDHKEPGRELPFEFVHERIKAYLEEAVRHRAMRQYVEELAARATIAGVDLVADLQHPQ